MFNRLKLWFVEFLGRVTDKVQVATLDVADGAGQELTQKFLDEVVNLGAVMNDAVTKLRGKVNGK